MGANLELNMKAEITKYGSQHGRQHGLNVLAKEFSNHPTSLGGPAAGGRSPLNPATEPFRLNWGPWSVSELRGHVVVDANTVRSPTFTEGKLP